MKDKFIPLDEMGDLAAPVGSKERAIALHELLRASLADTTSNVEHLKVRWQAAIREQFYEQLTNKKGQPFKSLKEYCLAEPPYGLGYDPEVIEEIIKTRESAQQKAERLGSEDSKLGPHGGDRKLERENQVCDTYLKMDANYYTRRIARDRPDILERMRAGEFPSVRAAALEAGIIRPRISIALEPALAARSLIKYFTPEQIVKLIVLLLQDIDMTLEDTFGAVPPINQPEDFKALRDIAVEEMVARAYAAFQQDPSRGVPYEEFRAELVADGLLDETTEKESTNGER